MKSIYLTTLILLLGLQVSFGLEEELTAIQDAVNTLYGSLSFEPGGKPDTALFLSVFIKDGTLINNNKGAEPNVISPKSFAESLSQMKGLIQFDEHEIRGETVFFGTIAHRFSTYEKYIEVGDRKVSGQGINSFQLVKINGKWMINSIIWNDEREDLKIPEAYQKKE